METELSIAINKAYVASSPVWICDGQLDQQIVVNFYHNVLDLSFRRSEKTYAKDDYPIFSVDFDPVVFEEKTKIGATARRLIDEYTGNRDYFLERAYVNMCHYGDVGTPHRDCDQAETDITVLYYANKEWRHMWGGETLFYENKDTRLAVLPRPGRFVVFPGAIEHNGSIPSRICTLSRLTLAMKFKERV